MNSYTTETEARKKLTLERREWPGSTWYLCTSTLGHWYVLSSTLLEHLQKHGWALTIHETFEPIKT